MTEYTPTLTDNSKKNAKYTLVGISHYHGDRENGHFWSEVYIFEDEKWYNCNDSLVK